MAGPWDKYKKTEAPVSSGTSGPWAKYAKKPIEQETPVVAPPKLPVGVTPDPEPEFEYLKPKRNVPDFEERDLNPEPMLDLSGAPMKPAFGDAPAAPVEQTYHTEMEPATGNIDEILASSLDEKGDVTSNIYDGLDYPTAVKVYEKLANHPDSQLVRPNAGQMLDPVGLGGVVQDYVVFKGHKVPFPEPNMLGQDKIGSSPGFATGVGESLADASSNLAQFALSIPDAALGTNISSSMERPEVKQEGIVDNLVHEGVPTVVGGMLGVGAASKVIQGASKVAGPVGEVLSKVPVIGDILGSTASKVGTVAKGTARLAGAEIGATAGLDEDANGIFAGKESLAGNPVTDTIMFNTDAPDMSEGEKTFYKKFNLATDSMLSGSIVGGVGRAFAKGLGVLKSVYVDGLTPAVSQAARDKMVNNEFMIRLGGLSDNASTEERAAVAEKLSQYMDAGQAQFKTLKDTGTSETVELDPLAAIIAGAQEAGDKELIQRASTLRNDILQSEEMTLSQNKQTSYKDDVIKPFKEDIYKAGGAETGVEASRSAVVRSGQEDIGLARTAREDASEAVTGANENYAQRMRDDPVFGDSISRLEKTSGINIKEGVQQSEDALATNAQKAEAAMYEKRKEFYDKIPNTVRVLREGDEGFDRLVYKADEETGELSDKFVEGLTPKMREIIGRAEGRFKVLHNELVPELSREIARLSKTGGGSKAETLQGIKDNILEDQMEILVNKGGIGRGKFADALKEARSYNQEYMNYFGKGAPLESIKKANSTKGLAEVNPGNAQENFRNTRTATRDNIVSGSDNRERASSLIEALRRPDVNGDPTTVLDYHVQDLALGLRNKAKNGKISEIEAEDFRIALQDEAASIEKEFPQAAAEIDNLLMDLEAGRGNINQKIEELARAGEAEDQIETTVKSEISPFIESSSGRELTEGQEIFSGIFDKKADLGTLDTIITRAKSKGELAGVQAAFGKKLQSVSLEDFNDPASNDRTMKIANKLFSDTPEVIDGIEEAYRLENLTKTGKGSRNGPDKLGAGANKEFGATVNKIVTLMFGVLNPTATRVRNITGVMAEKNAPSDGLKATIDLMASNPKEFKELVGKFNKRDRFSIENKRLLTEFLSRASLRSGPLTDKQREYIDSEFANGQTEEMTTQD